MVKTRETANGEAPTFDLASFDKMQAIQEAGLDVEIRGPDNKKLGFSIKVAGPDSELQRSVVEKLTNERLQSEDISPLTASEMDTRKTRGLAMSTMGWTDFILDGKVLPFSTDNAYKLFRRFPFIRDQIEEKASRRTAFLGLSNSDASLQSNDGSLENAPAHQPPDSQSSATSKS